MLVRIDQRLQDPPRVLMLPADEAAVFGVPLFIGLLGQAVVPGFLMGAVLWAGWRRMKGDGGLVMLAAALYWHLPWSSRFFPGLPDSSVSVWEG